MAARGASIVCVTWAGIPAPPRIPGLRVPEYGNSGGDSRGRVEWQRSFRMTLLRIPVPCGGAFTYSVRNNARAGSGS